LSVSVKKKNYFSISALSLKPGLTSLTLNAQPPSIPQVVEAIPIQHPQLAKNY